MSNNRIIPKRGRGKPAHCERAMPQLNSQSQRQTTPVNRTAATSTKGGASCDATTHEAKSSTRRRARRASSRIEGSGITSGGERPSHMPVRQG